MNEQVSQAAKKIMDPSLKRRNEYALQFAALSNALGVAAANGEMWKHGAEAFIESVRRGDSLEQAYLNALNTADPSGNSVRKGVDAIDRFADRLKYLATLSNGWEMGEGGRESPSAVEMPSSKSSDPYEVLMEAARTTVNQLISRGKETREYKGDDGRSVKGWLIETIGEYSNREFHISGGRYEESWGRTHFVLTTEGEFYFLRFSGEAHNNSGEDFKELTNTLEKCKQSSLVGSQGKPFSALIAKLERMPWR